MDRERIRKPMSEKTVALTPRQKITAAILSGVLGVSACIPQKRSGYVEATPTPLSPPATEIVPNPYLTPEVHQEELSVFGGFLIGESGIGKITSLDLQENPDPITIQEVTTRLIQAKPDIKAESVQVYVYDMTGEKGYAPFIMAAEKDGDKIKRAFVGFWVDEKGIQRPPYGGEVYVFYPLGIYKQADGSELIGATTKDGNQLYLPALFIKKGDSLVFIPPYTDSLNTQVSPAKRAKEVFDQNISYKIATATAVPQTPTETLTPEPTTIPEIAPDVWQQTAEGLWFRRQDLTIFGQEFKYNSEKTGELYNAALKLFYYIHKNAEHPQFKDFKSSFEFEKWVKENPDATIENCVTAKKSFWTTRFPDQTAQADLISTEQACSLSHLAIRLVEPQKAENWIRLAGRIMSQTSVESGSTGQTYLIELSGYGLDDYQTLLALNEQKSAEENALTLNQKLAIFSNEMRILLSELDSGYDPVAWERNPQGELIQVLSIVGGPYEWEDFTRMAKLEYVSPK